MFNNNVLMFNRTPSPKGMMVECSREMIAARRDTVHQPQLAEQIATHAQHLERRIAFSADTLSGQILVVVMDGEGGGVIRCIHPEQALRYLRSATAPS